MCLLLSVQVPAGKELVRPEACFVVKSYVTADASAADGKGEKIFVNVVQSDKIAKPTSVPQKDGVQMSLPLSMGPKRLEKDKGGEALVPTFDACFHPDALALVRGNNARKEVALQNYHAQASGGGGAVTAVMAS